MKLNNVAVVYVLAAMARLLWTLEGTVAHYSVHSDLNWRERKLPTLVVE